MREPRELQVRRQRWMADRALIWRSWDPDEYVVYSPSSGDTHLINEVTAEVLRQLERATVGFPDLVRNVARSLECAIDEQIADHVARLLVYLDEIGLVESAP